MAKINLYKRTLKLLNKTQISVAQISKDTGLQERWLHLVKRDKMKDPGVKKIEKIFDYLSK